MLKQLLTKYWLTFVSPPHFASGIGVTAYGLEDAETLVSKHFFANGPVPAFENKIIKGLQELEPNHVLPNIGLIMFRGIWFPNTSPENR